MKRIIAILLVVITVLSSVLTLSGCGATREEDALTMGQWLTYVADSFGLQNYTNEEPYFKSVDKTNTFFSVFQSAVEWNIIEPSDEITPETPLTWNDVLLSLVNAGEFLNEDTEDKEKIDYALKHFDSSLRKYWGNRYIKVKQAIPLLDKAQALWVAKEFDKKIEKAEFSDEVVNLIENKELEYSSMQGKIIIPESETVQLNVGDVYTLPGNGENGTSINRIKAIEVIDGNMIITNDDSFTEEEAAEYVGEVIVQETSSPDFTQIAGIYDENGNPIAFEIDNTDNISNMTSKEGMNAQLTTLMHANNQQNPEVIQTGIFDNIKGTLKFTIDKWEVSITTTKDNFSVKLARTLDKATNLRREEKKQAFVSTTFENVKLTRDVDFSWGKLHSATVKLDYKTKIEGGITAERTNKVGEKANEGENLKKSLNSVITGYKNALETLKQDVNNSKYAGTEIYICKLKFLNYGIISADFVVKGKITASGEMKLVIELEGAQGIQYKNGNLRYIKSSDVDVNFVAEGKLELTIGPGLEIAILDKWLLVNFSVDVGAGVSLGATAHLLDIEGHKLYSGPAELNADDAADLESEKEFTTAEDLKAYAEEQGGTWSNYENMKGQSVEVLKGLCIEWKLYPILRIGLLGRSLINDVAKKFGVTLSVEVLGSKTPILKGHIDGLTNFVNMVKSSNVLEGMGALFGVGAECIYDFKPWDNAVEEADKVDEELNVEQDEIDITENIVLSTFRVHLNVGQTADIRITGLPKGYEPKDLEAEVEDTKIAKIDVKKGIITAGDKCGTTEIVVRTKDKKYKVYCAVTVTEDAGVEFEGIEL